MNSLLVNDEEINGSGGEMEEAVEEEIEVFISIFMELGNFLMSLNFVQVANVTRAGCEKASTGQFELLR